MSNTDFLYRDMLYRHNRGFLIITILFLLLILLGIKIKIGIYNIF